jgi:hypothetical protein
MFLLQIIIFNILHCLEYKIFLIEILRVYRIHHYPHLDLLSFRKKTKIVFSTKQNNKLHVARSTKFLILSIFHMLLQFFVNWKELIALALPPTPHHTHKPGIPHARAFSSLRLLLKLYLHGKSPIALFTSAVIASLVAESFRTVHRFRVELSLSCHFQ